MDKIYTAIKKCRICGSRGLTDVLDLGKQALTGVFPKPEDSLNYSPVVICKCDHCHLVQLRHTVQLDLMYGETYGYESSLNSSMVSHLEGIAEYITNLNILQTGDIILDIGSNDGTFLKCFGKWDYRLVGVDPTVVKFEDTYIEHGMWCIPEFFHKDVFTHTFMGTPAKVITSIACFYDLEDPVKFAQDTADVLDENGVWVMEMAYLPLIIQNLCFDGYVQEHLEYYSLRDIKFIMDQVGLKIIDVSFNDANGGSFRVTAVKQTSKHDEYWRLKSILLQEKFLELSETHWQYETDVRLFKDKFVSLLEKLKRLGKTVYGIGASTKFNSVLQYCNINHNLITAIGEVNDYKFGRITPGTNIPIIPEKEVLANNPDYLVVGPYHFRDSFIKMFDEYLEGGGKLVFPLPDLEIVGK